MPDTQTMETTRLTITLDIATEDLANAITAGMIPGGFGYGYWCYVDRIKTARGAPGDNYGDRIVRAVLEGRSARFPEYDERSGKVIEWHTLTRAKLARGVAMWLVAGARSAGQIDDKGVTTLNLDAGDSDLIIQGALFGEQKYG